MLDLGGPSSYLALAGGIEVFSSDEQPFGKVEHVLACFSSRAGGN